MITENELIWYEENWNSHLTGRKAESHRRSWKLREDIWDTPREGCMSNENFRNQRCWKKKRKTHYRIKPIKKVKKRKPAQREHWRYKSNSEFSRIPHWSKNAIDNRQAIVFLERLLPGDFIIQSGKWNSYYAKRDISFKVTERYYEGNKDEDIKVVVKKFICMNFDAYCDNNWAEYGKPYYLGLDYLKEASVNYNIYREDEIYSLCSF